MVRDSNPLNPGEDGVWFRMRDNGRFINVPTEFPSNDPKLAWMPLSALTSRKPTASALLVVFADDASDDYHLYVNGSSKSPANGNDKVDLDKYGLTRKNAIVIEEKKKKVDSDDGDDNAKNSDSEGDDGKGGNTGDEGDDGKDGNTSDQGNNSENDGSGKDNDNSTGREYPPRFPHTNGYWFVVQNRHGNNIDVSAGATAVDNDDSTLGWNPIPKDSDLPTFFVGSGRIRKKITQSLDLDPQDYKLYGSQSDDDSNHYTDNYVIDFRSVGLRGNDPMMVKYNTSRDNDSDSGSENGDDGNGGNDQDNSGSVNTDPYANFTRRLENITTGDWSIYPEAITGTYSGEILWTDGNPSYSFASAPNIQAYKVVRRNPSVYNGTVIQTGLASTSPYYFKLLD